MTPPRLMYDGYDPWNLPVVAPPNLYACYKDGVYTADNLATAEHRFPGLQIVSISTDGSGHPAVWYDCENGDYGPLSALYAARHNPGSGIYGSRSTWDQLLDLGANPLTIPAWVADPGFVNTLANGIVALPSGRLFQATAVQGLTIPPGYDVSYVYSDAWQALPVPTPPPVPPAPKPPRERTLAYLASCTADSADGTVKTGTVWQVDGNTRVQQFDVTLYGTLGKPVPLSGNDLWCFQDVTRRAAP